MAGVCGHGGQELAGWEGSWSAQGRCQRWGLVGGGGPGSARGRGGSPSGLSHQLRALLPNDSAGAICTAAPSTLCLQPTL